MGFGKVLMHSTVSWQWQKNGRKTLDEGGEKEAALTDRSKAFDWTDHNLLIIKLNTYRFEKQSIDFVYFYPTKSKQRTKVGPECSQFMRSIISRCASRLCFRATFIYIIYIYKINIYIYIYIYI